MSAALKHAEPGYGDGDGGGGFDPRDITIHVLETELAEFRAVMRRLLDSEGPGATEAIEAAERLLEAHDQVEREIEDEAHMLAFDQSPVCDCGTWKGVGTSYCPECDADALERLKAPPSNIVPLARCPF